MPILIERVRIDDLEISKPGSRIILQPEDHRLEIHYAGLDLASPESVLYRYRLEGLDNDWLEVGNRHTAYYQNLPPGTYRFRVIGANRLGAWNQVGAGISLTVMPHWWQRAIVRIGGPVMLLVFLALFGLHRIRRIKQQALERGRIKDEFSRALIEAQEAERLHIAGELHDDLGQDLLVMKSRVDRLRRKMEIGDARHVLDQLSESAAGVLKKIRGLSHELRPLHLDHLGLSTSILKLAEQVSEASGIEILTELDDLNQALPKASEIAIYRMVQESLNNIVKHAEAKTANVKLKRHNHSLTLSISDDGRGFDPLRTASLRRGIGHGIEAMRERCSLIGGRLELNSNPGQGTLIRIEVPLQVKGSEKRDNS